MADALCTSSLSSLPGELKCAILHLMDLDTLKHMRLTSKLWAILGEIHLIPPAFTAFSYRNDFPRLQAISQHPVYSIFIHYLTFNLGDMDESNARSGRYSKLHPLIKLYAPLVCDPGILSQSFSSLPNLSSLSISLANNPSIDEPALAHLRHIWVIPTSRSLRRGVVCRRFGTILETLLPHITKTRLRRLAHDCLPIEFFVQKQSRIESFHPIFSQLSEIELVLNTGDLFADEHFVRGLKNLGRCLRCAKGLKRLSLTCLARGSVIVSPLFMELVPQEDAEEETYFPQLEFFHLEAVMISFDLLVRFVLGLKGSLRDLELGGEGSHPYGKTPRGGVHLITGRYKDLFERVREGMAKVEGGNGLERFVVKGDLVDASTDREGVGGYGRVIEWTRVEELEKRFNAASDINDEVGAISVEGLVL